MLRAALDARRRRRRLALGSDAPVSPLDPWLAIAAAVHRSADEREPWHPEQAITAARGAGRLDRRPRGRVAPGIPADLVLLDADPLAEQGSAAETAAYLRGMADRVVATWVAGEQVFTAEA